ncbi:MAG: PAS domain S-box protein [Chloroflexi bacterium]|nr:PAS domain S-box protein [Chloroflexota bacterium]
MVWLAPAVIATLSGTFILILIYAYLYSEYREQHLGIWLASWIASAVRFGLQLWMLFTQPTPILQILHQAATLISAVFLLCGMHAFLGKRPFSQLSKWWVGATAVIFFWIIIAISFNFSFLAINIPTFTFLGLVTIWTGVVLMREMPESGVGSHLTGWAFIIWGIHKMDFPFLRPLLWFAPWGYLLAELLEFTVALGILLIYFQKTQRDLSDSEEKYRSLFAAEPDALIIIDATIPKHVDVNEAALEMYGYSREEFMALEFDAISAEPEKTQTQAQMGEAGTEVKIPLRYHRKKDGTIFPVEISASFFTLQGRKMACTAIRDITERIEAEEHLLTSETRFRTLVEQSPYSIVIYRPNGRLVFANQFAARLWNVSPEGLAQFYAEYNILEDPYLIEQGLMPHIQKGFAGEASELPSVQYRPRQPETPLINITKPMWIKGYIFPVKDEAGSVREVVVMHQDISKRRETEEALHQVQKTESLGILAGGIAHDFNNLLVAMLGQNSLALAKMRPESPSLPHVEKAMKATERAASLTKQMLAYSGRGHFEIRPLNLNRLIEENLHLFQVSVPKTVHLQSSLHHSLPMIQADAGQMQQVVMNLIINGADAIGDHPGTVIVLTDVQEVSENDRRYQQYTGNSLLPGRYVTLEIHDNGAGMDDNTAAKIFDPFFSTKDLGHGLGLAAVLGIVRGHNGGIYVYSELGKGTTFKLLFPVDETTVEEEEVQSRSNLEKTKQSGLILVIDDEQPVREAVTDILEAEGYEVITAVNGKKGLALYKTRIDEVSLVLLDLSMPGMNGAETFRELQQLNPNVRVILSSGYNQIEATNRFAEKGLAGFLQKPYTINALTETVKQYL